MDYFSVEKVAELDVGKHCEELKERIAATKDFVKKAFDTDKVKLAGIKHYFVTEDGSGMNIRFASEEFLRWIRPE